MNAVVKYPGSKWSLADWIISFFPEHHSYLEPYFGSGERVGWKNDVQGRERAYAAQDWCRMPERIVRAAERLRGVQIECRPAAELIQRFNHPSVLIYADPPYVLGTRHGKQYRHEMDNGDHEELLDVLLAHKGPVLVSGYDTELYGSRLRGWHREEHWCRSQTGGRKREVLWMNFDPPGQLRIPWGRQI